LIQRDFKPGKNFRKVLWPITIYKALLQKSKKSGKMAKHVCEVEKDLVTLQKKRTKENLGKGYSGSAS
jgi:hypothetical protein